MTRRLGSGHLANIGRPLPLLIALLLAVCAQPTAARTTNVCSRPGSVGYAPTAGGVAAIPLTVRDDSHVVVMEYEAWFGPHAVTFQPDVTTCLQSSDMEPVGGGYDSTDPGVIAKHVTWLRRMGVDAVTADLTNNVSCIFDGDNRAIIENVCPDPKFRAQQLNIRDNTGHLYSAWSALGTPLKIIPMLGGFDRYAVTPDKDDSRQRTALEKEAGYFERFMADFPAMSVIYHGKPLMLIYAGTPVDPKRVRAIRGLLEETRLDRRYTFRLIAGYLDSQPAFWADPDETPDGPIRIAPCYGFWSVVDRLNSWGAPPDPYYPTYNRVASGVENMTASIATAGQTGWSCATKPGEYRYCPDAALRYCGQGHQNGCDRGNYETLAEFMTYARSLKPTFLILDQFNEFTQPDEGWNAETNDDVEPTRQWEFTGVQAVIDQVTLYRTSTPPR